MVNYLRLTAAFWVAMALLAGERPTAAQELQSVIIDRLNRIERDVSDLKRQFYRGEVPPPGEAAAETREGPSSTLLADHESRLGRLEEEIRNLTGMVEEAQHSVRQVSDRLDKLVADIDYRLRTIEENLANDQAAGAGAAAQSPPPAAEGSAARPAPGEDDLAAEGGGDGERPTGVLGTIPFDADVTSGAGEAAEDAPESEVAALPGGAGPQEKYDHAFSLMQRADYAGAQAAFDAFLQEHPDHQLASNAHYWLGETHYVRSEFEQAAIAFMEGYRAAPEGNKAPDSLLKLGLTLDKMGDKADACATLDKLLGDFPAAPATVRGRAEQEQRNLGCG